MRDSVVFSINGKVHRVGRNDAGLMLADYLRQQQRLVGTKVVCAEGDCGACTVLKVNPSGGTRNLPPLPVNSCILPVAQLDGAQIVTVEGLGGNTPVQESMTQCHGSQCGFCTPGFVMALTGLVEKKLHQKRESPSITEREAKNATTGNLCRCTGYQPILDAATSIDVRSCRSVREGSSSGKLLKELRDAIRKPVWIQGSEFRFFAPTRLADLGRFLRKEKQARVVAGATDLGVVHNKRKQPLQVAVSLRLIPELTQIRRNGRRLRIGAAVTLSEVRAAVWKSHAEFARFLDLFASPQIKNQATLVGNLVNASPIGDTSPFLLVSGSVVHAYDWRKSGAAAKRKIPLEKFFTGYRKTALRPGEVVTGIEIDIPKAAEKFALYKVSQRKDLDISTVSAAFRASLKKGRLVDVRVALGGVGATPLRFPRTERFLATLKSFQSDEFDPRELSEVFQSEMNPIPDLRSSAAFRRVAAENLLRKFLREQVLGGLAHE